MTTKLPLVVLILLLAGCQSEFEKCMATELPRAEMRANLEHERNAGRALVSLQDFSGKLSAITIRMDKWYEQNPLPSELQYPKYKCSGKSASGFRECTENHDNLVEKYEADVEIWKSTYSGQIWAGLRDEAYLQAGLENGVAITNEEDYEHLVNEQLTSMESVLRPRSTIYRCLRDYKCEDYDYLDLDHIGYEEVLQRAYDEAVLINAGEISSLVKATKELATVTCNNNGIYE